MGACLSPAQKTPKDATAAPTTTPKAELTQPPPGAEMAVVLLGQGESGKSTIFKQMKIIQAREEGTAEFTHEERLAMRYIVWSNVTSQMRVLIRVARDEQMEYSSSEIATQAQQLADDVLPLEPGSEAARNLLKILWAEESLRVIYGERDRLYNLSDGVSHFWNDLDRVFSPNYVPTNEDILRTRLRTVGFDEAVFSYKGSRFRVHDVGGQRSERRKWQEQIDTATCVLFVSGLTEWDQRLREDFSQSRMEESLHLWAELTDVVQRSQQNRDKEGGLAIVLLLNKLDLFMEKLRGPAKANFQKYFTTYKGRLDWAPCAGFIKDAFLAISAPKQINATVHLVSALEADSVRLLWQDVRDMLRDRLLREFNLM